MGRVPSAQPTVLSTFLAFLFPPLTVFTSVVTFENLVMLWHDVLTRVPTALIILVVQS